MDKGKKLMLALVLIAAFLAAGTLDYIDARKQDCDKHGMGYDWDLDVCVKGEGK